MLSKAQPLLDELSQICKDWKCQLDERKVPKYVIDMPEKRIRWLTLNERTEMILGEHSVK